MPDSNTTKTNQINNPILSARDIYFSYPPVKGKNSFSVSIDRFDISPAERVALIGPNGAGKTTLLQILAFLQPPAKGAIVFNGIGIRSKLQQIQYHRTTAFVPQKTVLYRGSVQENIAVGLKIRGEGQTTLEQKVTEITKSLHIEHLMNRPSWQISGGEARRVMLARALVLKPQILFLDEPFAELDEPVRLELIQDLLPVLSKTRCAIIFSAHNQNEICQLSERVMVMINGEIIQSGRTNEVFSQPINQEVAEFIGIRNILPARVTGNQNDLISISLLNTQGKDCANLLVSCPQPQTNQVLACIPPEAVIIVLEQHPDTHYSSRNSIPAVIKRIIPSRYFSFLEVDCGRPDGEAGVLITASVTNESVKELMLVPGKDIHLLIKATAIQLLEK